MPLKVIGAGLPRTGTFSLKLALEQLGFGPCGHVFAMTESENAARYAHGERFYDGEPFDWEDIFQGLNSAVDTPTCHFYRRIAEAFPAAKVVLTVRDPADWFRSTRATVASPEVVGQRTVDPNLDRFLRKQGAAMARENPEMPKIDPDVPDLEQRVIGRFNRHTEQVIRTIAPERLLVFEVKQGWAPLCAFLGVPVPDAPFPRENSSDDFQNRWQSHIQS